MAALLSQLSNAHSHDGARRPQSQPQSAPRSRQASSSHHPKSRPADPVVINSILESFDTLRSPSILTGDDGRSYPARGLTRPQTSYETRSSPPLFPASSSPGFGMEYPAGLRMDDESGSSRAAMPPAIRTNSREGSGLYKVPSPLSTTSPHRHDKKRSSSGGSYHSFSLARKEKERGTKNKLSAESWVKQSPASPRSPSAVDWPKQEHEKALRQKPSDDSIRPPKSRIEIIPTPSVASNLSGTSSMSRAEQIIAQASASRGTGPKRRLYLTDTGSEEQSINEAYGSIAEATEVEEDGAVPLPQVNGNVDSVIQQILEDHVKVEEEQMTAPDRVARRTSIVDSIPMRTSSLRQPSSSPAPSRKTGKKSKRRSEIGQMVKMRVGAQRDSFVSTTSSKDIPDSSWNDLGEEDETVKRILELREQRKARMLEPPATSPRGLSPSVRSDASSIVTSDQRSARSENGYSSALLIPEASPNDSDKKSRPTTMFMIERELNSLSVERPPLNERASSDPPPPPVPPKPKTPIKDVQPPNMRSATSYSNASEGSPSAGLALDYSYVAAVDALQSPRLEKMVDIEKRPSSAAPRLPAPRLPVTPTPIRNPASPAIESIKQRSAPAGARSRSFRWRTPIHHPDLPLEYTSKKSHLRSPSLGLGGNKPSLEQPRDSVDLAVDEFLQAERLNRKIRHPLTGRKISFSEVGDPTGAVVIICLGMGLTRYVSAFYDELASTLRLRLITIDRPGVGQSEPYPPGDKSGPLSWPDDVLAVCQHLGVTCFSMLAHSAGAIYALATAMILPHLIQGKLHLLSPWIPPSQLGVVSSPAAVSSGGILPRSQRLLRVLPTPFFKAANSSFMTATSASLGPNGKNKYKTELRRPGPSLAPESRPSSRFGRRGNGNEPNNRDSILLMDQFMPDINPTDTFPMQPDNPNKPMSRHSTYPVSPTSGPADPHFTFASHGLDAAQHVAATKRQHEYTALLTQRTWELATRDSNPATDLLTCLERHRDIGFRYTDVHREVIITHGSEDKRVPVANVRWLADQMNRHSVTFGAGKAGGGSGGLVAGGCEIRVLNGEGHGLMANPVIMGDLLTEIAGYWNGGAGA